MSQFSIIGTPLYQWESGRRLKIVPLRGMTVDSVHFSNYGDSIALVVKPKEENGHYIADIPNILLQDDQNIVVYSVNVSEEKVETLRECVFPVYKRAKPSNYVYTETEVLNYASLDKRIVNLEGEGLSKAVAAYLKENPVAAGATKEEAAQIKQNKEDIKKLSTDKLDAVKLPEAVNEALAQAKASGEFDGADGDDGFSPIATVKETESGALITVTDKNGTTTVTVKNGQDGEKGDKGDPYTLTESDKSEIAEQAAALVGTSNIEIFSGLYPDGTNLPTISFTPSENIKDGKEHLFIVIPNFEVVFDGEKEWMLNLKPITVLWDDGEPTDDSDWMETFVLTDCKIEQGRGMLIAGKYDTERNYWEYLRLLNPPQTIDTTEIAKQAASLIDTDLLSAIGSGVLE